MEVVEAHLQLAPMLAEYAGVCSQAGIEKYQGVANAPSEYLQSLVERSLATEALPSGWLPSTTWYCVSEGKILGAIRVRRGTNPYVENIIGHIGYETRPDARNQGVASFLLGWVRDHVIDQSVIITCSVENLASRKVIERCGGQYLGDYTDSNEGTVRRYQINP